MLIRFVPFLVICSTALAQYRPSNEQPPEPVREFRGAWVASVWNIDWPSSPQVSAAGQRAELTRILDQAAALKLNAIILQVRTECDALYDSKIEPWSYWLTARQGVPPRDGVDPLPRAIAEADARGIELHAWFNPFRAKANRNVAAARNHVTRQHPEWLLPAGDQVWLNPGLREVQDRAIAVMTDVAKRYDVDGIHIDDYFYPYPKKINGRMVQTFDDSATYERYRRSGGRLSVGDWRRNQMDGFIQRLSEAVHRTDPAVKFGVSPFGIWRPGVPPSIEADLDAYEHIAANSRRWLQEGWVDYFSPQLYWRIDDTPHSYTTLVQWWASQNTQKRHLWPGIASSRIRGEGSDKKRSANESVRQIEQARAYASNGLGAGHIHWSWSAIEKDRGGLRGVLPYEEPALVPATPWLAGGAPLKVAAPRVEVNALSGGLQLSWQGSREARWWVVQARDGRAGWRTVRILGGEAKGLRVEGMPEAVAVRAVDSFGRLSPATTLTR